MTTTDTIIAVLREHAFDPWRHCCACGHATGACYIDGRWTFDYEIHRAHLAEQIAAVLHATPARDDTTCAAGTCTCGAES